jgi:energy-coupling factor transport system substrate-specific component
MSWQLGILLVLAATLVAGGVWFERSRPSARILAAVAALAALGVAGRVALAPLPNVVATTDIALLAGYALGGAPGFAVGALSALVSNIWLGQGPWTPWQMAGWGMVGVGGAALATLAGRRLGRWGLAVAAAVAGLLYGALLDLSAMVNFGGEQSVDRYLALSARAIPFNAAHAAGNAALMLAAGPALARMLGRYRDRFEVDWREARPLTAPLAVALLALAVALPLAGPGAAGGAVANGAGVGGARAWLASVQNRDGGWGASPGASSNPDMTGWAMLGLAVSGRNPLDVRGGGRSPVDYLRRNAGGLDSTGDLERTILALRSAGLSVREFAGRDLLAELRSRQRSNGSYGGQVGLTAFAILARSAAGEGKGSLSKSAQWLQEAQNRNGGWGSVPAAGSEPDSTGAALQALVRTRGRPAAVAAGASWLRKAQRGDGGWSLTPGVAANSQSAAWAIQGLLVAGGASGAVRDGLSYLGARQRGDGHYSYSKASDQTPVWVTAQVLAAVNRKPFPVAPVERRQRSGGSHRSGSSSGGGGEEGAAAAGGSGATNRTKSAKGGKAKRSRGSGASETRAARRAVAKDAAEVAEIAASPAAALAPQEADHSRLPSTPLLLGGLAALAGALGGGYFVHRRRLR